MESNYTNRETEMNQEMNMPNIEVETIAPNGLGYGKGSISVKKRRESGELTPGMEAIVEHEVRNPDNFEAVEFGDDGCGDGRGTSVLYELSIVDDEIVKRELKRSGVRAKIFGGGLIVGWIAERAVQGPINDVDTVTNDRRKVALRLQDADMQFGAHTSDHAVEGKSGCGAIDESPAIIVSAVEFEEQIRENVKSLRTDIYNDERFEKVMSVFRSIAESQTYFGDGSIEETQRILAESKAIVKELRGAHTEIRFIRNEVKGHTINQAAIIAQTHDEAEAFVDDVWRRDEYAVVLGNGHDEDTAIAALATEVWTLAVAATLTDGSLPVDRITESKKVSQQIPVATAA